MASVVDAQNEIKQEIEALRTKKPKYSCENATQLAVKLTELIHSFKDL